MQIECLIRATKSGKGYYLYIPYLEKYVLLDNGAEKKLVALYVEAQNKKSDNK